MISALGTLHLGGRALPKDMHLAGTPSFLSLAGWSTRPRKRPLHYKGLVKYSFPAQRNVVPCNPASLQGVTPMSPTCAKRCWTCQVRRWYSPSSSSKGRRDTSIPGCAQGLEEGRRRLDCGREKRFLLEGSESWPHSPSSKDELTTQFCLGGFFLPRPQRWTCDIVGLMVLNPRTFIRFSGKERFSFVSVARLYRSNPRASVAAIHVLMSSGKTLTDTQK